MTDFNIDPDEYDFGEDSEEVSLAPDEKHVGGKKSEWLKFAQKGQLVRCSFVYFHTVDVNAVRAAAKKAKKAGEPFGKEQIVEVATAALKARAEELGKKPEELTDVDKIDLRKSHFKVMKASYQEGMGYVVSRLGKDGSEADAIWKRLPDPKTYFSTLLLVYPTDREGNLNKEEFVKQLKEDKLQLLPWRFSNRVYESIFKLNSGLRENGLSLAAQDIKIECKEPQFQNIDVSFAGAAVWQKLGDDVKTKVLRAAVPMYESLNPFREMTTEQLKAKLGLGGSATEDVSADDFQDMLDQV